MSRFEMIWGGTVSGTSLTPKNTAGINIFAANTSFRRKAAKSARPRSQVNGRIGLILS
jgi:hypothetical protein